MRRLLCALLILSASWVNAQTSEATIRICDDSGCSERPRSSASFDPALDQNPEETQRLAAMAAVARNDPRAAYDLALRYFRGDGIQRDSHQAIRWMREAGERGVPDAQLALGRFYLMGVEEMGADPVEAVKWLSLAAPRLPEAAKLLADAQNAMKSEQDLYAWRESQRKNWLIGWHRGYPYHGYWHQGGWHAR